MTNACPLVCCTALAISKERSLIRRRISTDTSARVSGPASRQAGSAALAAAMSAPVSGRG